MQQGFATFTSGNDTEITADSLQCAEGPAYKERSLYFSDIQAEGMKNDNDDNLYASCTNLMIFNPAGQVTREIKVTGTITNVFVTEEQGRAAFITTNNTIYKLKL